MTTSWTFSSSQCSGQTLLQRAACDLRGRSYGIGVVGRVSRAIGSFSVMIYLRPMRKYLSQENKGGSSPRATYNAERVCVWSEKSEAQNSSGLGALGWCSLC